ncbi:DUF2530 domain-containing protein [Actinocorallia sp. API 0066]|uniref:DUF2530 domain-containing protein n=1 Tax=Actinocorallia sp. API 0066 TaxID=2896846 RepID=UPI001E3BAB6E|nr:DUF2530 domain-containing protein [Actinocorallia sp. API 0066]MCD0447681.1 DUF2530 domain-containing protein [Actinocorallia sp. API 0066]
MARPHLPQPEPIETNNVRVAAVGTAAWVVAFVVLLAVGLPEDAHWWLWVCVTGTVIGVFACLYLPRFERKREPHADVPDDGSEAPGRP